MGDQINNSDIFKSLGFESHDMWIFYQDSFQKFFSFFENNIDEENILSEQEGLEIEDIMQTTNQNEYHMQLKHLETVSPGLWECTKGHEAALKEDIKLIEEAEDEFSIMVEEMLVTKTKLNMNLNELDNFNGLQKAAQKILATCQSKAKQLEEAQRENSRLCNENKKCFTKPQSPPLFIHQMPLDQYVLKCDSFLQYLILYMKENFKLKENMNLSISATESKKYTATLNDLEKSIQHYTSALFKEKAKAKAMQSLIEHLDLSYINVISLTDMERETLELERINEHHLAITYKALLNDLEIHVKQHARQQIELILYENTKQKLRRANKLHENDKQLTKIIYEALSNAEILWMAIQLDLEKRRNRFDTAEKLTADTSNCMRRIKTLEHKQNSPDVDDWLNAYTEKISELLSQHVGQLLSNDPKVWLHEYEKFGRLLIYLLQGVLKNKPHIPAMNLLNELNNNENVLKSMVYDSPVKNPLLDNINFLQSIFKAKENRQRIDEAIRNWRSQYKNNIAERMNKDKLWRDLQMFWIWFLTEPKLMLSSIEQAKKSATQFSLTASDKSFVAGIKRN